jgi:CRISPR-associated protein Cmr4
VVSGSAVKGVMRAESEAKNPPGFVDSAFGSEKQPSDGAGAVTFGDARLLLLPVRSVRLLFAWVTSPYLLRRYVRDREASGFDVTREGAALERVAAERRQAACSDLRLLLDAKADAGTVYVEDADLPARVVPEVRALAEALASRCLPGSIQSLLTERLLVVDDTLLGTFSRQCTEIAARVRIDNDKKTVASGQLWYEEALPAETVLYAGVLAEDTRGRANGRWTSVQHIDMLQAIVSAQFGGKASVGRGLCHLAWERV